MHVKKLKKIQLDKDKVWLRRQQKHRAFKIKIKLNSKITREYDEDLSDAIYRIRNSV